MSRNDGYDPWREEEAAKLENLVEKQINFLQNPKNCSNAKKIFCDYISDKSGFGEHF